MVGLPASGKTTLAKSLVALDSEKLGYVSRDEVRHDMLGTYKTNTGKEILVLQEFCERILFDLLLTNHDAVFADATHITPWSRFIFYNTFMKLVKEMPEFEKDEIEIIPLTLDTPWEICYKRNSMRPEERRVPDDEMKNFYREKVSFPLKDDFSGFDSAFPKRLYYDSATDSFNMVTITFE
jgi:predicted kinase